MAITKQHTSTSLNQKAWKRLKRNKSAMFGLGTVVLAFLLSVFAYVVAPDNSPSGNEQILQLETHQPGFAIDILKKRRTEAPATGIIKGLTDGFVKGYEPIPVLSYEVKGDSVTYNEYRGRSFRPEQKTTAISDLAARPVGNLSAKDFEKEFVAHRKFWLGTDKFGRDILSRLLIGVRVSLSVGLISVIISLIIGVTLGALAGYFQAEPPSVKIFNLLSYLIYVPIVLAIPLLILIFAFKPDLGILISFASSVYKPLLFAVACNLIALFIKIKVKFPVDGFIMWIINVFWSIPTLLLAMGLYISAGDLIQNKLVMIFIAVGLTMWVETARIVRGQFLPLRQMEFVSAAKSLGFSDARIIFNHIVPNILGPIIVVACSNFASAILVESGLSYIGLGIQPPAPSWGSMLNEYKDFIDTNKAYLALFPGLAIMLLVLAFNLVGNGLRDALDVKGQLD